MSQPPRSPDNGTGQPSWRRPRGVAPGTWEYVNQRLIADRYDQFVADTPLCDLDQSILQELFPRTEQQEIVLDLGCGSGRTAIPLAKRGYRLIGVDLSQAMLDVMMNKSVAATQIMPLRCNLVELDCISDNTADHAVCMFSTLGMIQGFDHRRTFLKHVSRILRPGGRFIVHVHNRWAALREPKGILSLITNRIESLRHKDVDFGDTVYQYRGLESMFMHRFSRSEIVRLMTQCGMEIERWNNVSLDGATISDSSWVPGGFIVVGRLPSGAAPDTAKDLLG